MRLRVGLALAAVILAVPAADLASGVVSSGFFSGLFGAANGPKATKPGVSGKAFAKTLSENDPAVKMIDLQLKSIIRGLQEQVGNVTGDGTVLRSATLSGRTIELKMQAPIDKYRSALVPGIDERRAYMRQQFCTGETLKLMGYGVAWRYFFVDRNGAALGNMVIDNCD